MRGLDPISIAGLPEVPERRIIGAPGVLVVEQFTDFGIHPNCLNCVESCKQYNAPNLYRFHCFFRRKRY